MVKKKLSANGRWRARCYTDPMPEANSVHLVGSFNDWDTSAHPMRRLKDGRFMAQPWLAPDCVHEFRYLVDGETWVNDSEAERYTPNPYGSDNCVITTYEDESP